MLKLYSSLLYLYPASYRREYGDEMLSVLASVQAEIREKSVLAQAHREVREAVGLLHGAMQEQLRSITGSHGNAMFSPRRMPMRHEYRFPKSAAVLMTIILVAVLFTIEKAETVSHAYANYDGGPLIWVEISVLPAFLIALVLAGAVAAMGWAVIYALRRSGIHRMSEVNPSNAQRSGR